MLPLMSLMESLLLDLQSSVSNSDLYKNKEYIISELFLFMNIELNFFLMIMRNFYFSGRPEFAEYFSVEVFLEYVKNYKSNIVLKTWIT